MRLSKNEAPAAMPYPPPANAATNALEAHFETRLESTPFAPPNARAVAELMDLVADHRRELFSTMLEALKGSESTGEHASRLMDLVAACGVAETTSPCATAMAISADLEKLANTASQWTHPAQIVKHPDTQALYRLCASRIESETGTSRERLKKIQPRLERTARLAEKAASRRSQSASRQPQWVDRWL